MINRTCDTCSGPSTWRVSVAGVEQFACSDHVCQTILALGKQVASRLVDGEGYELLAEVSFRRPHAVRP